MTEMSTVETIGAFVGAAVGSLLVVLTLAIVVWRRHLGPWFREHLSPSLQKSDATYAAVNAGRVDRIEAKVNENHGVATRGIGRLEEQMTGFGRRFDNLERRVDDHHTSVSDRLTTIDTGQREILAELQKET